MQNTTVTTSFTSTDTVQLRFELGTITDAVATDQIPDYDSLEQGWIWDNGWIGRVQLSGETFMPLDTYNASDIDPLFDAPGGQTANRVAAVDDQSLWSVTVNGVEVDVEALSRKSAILDSATVGWGQYDFRTLQNVFLTLDAPLAEGDVIEVSFDDARFASIVATYDPSEVVSEAIHVNLTGYDPDDIRKVAYLSSWNGWSAAEQATVAQEYDGALAFRVVNQDTGAVALSGFTSLATPVTQNTDFERNFSLTDVWEMDLSELSEAGTYAIEVDGVGLSQSFDVSDTVWADVFETSFSGFYHQRSGIALEADYTDWTRDRALHPADGKVTVYATTLAITDTDESYDQSQPDQFGPLVAAATDEVLEDAWGGWHDAGDWDRRTQHLEASRKLTDLVEIAPDWAESKLAQIPENTNGLPDLLDEALWNLEFFARLQTADGGVRGGIEGDDYRGYGANSAEEEHNLYAYAPDTWTTWEFAASAAKMARVIDRYDPDAAALWLERAERAMTWAEARVPEDIDIVQTTSRNLAAAELYATTGDAGWHALFLQTSSFSAPDAVLAWNQYQYEASTTYNRLDASQVDAGVAQRGFAALEAQAEFLLTEGSTGGFGFIADPHAPYGWGVTASQPFNAAKFMIALHDLTGEDRYLAAIQGDVQYGLGANPLNMSYLTGIEGVRTPEIILNADADSMGGTPPPGITLYGDYSVYDYGQHPAYDTMWNDLFPNAYEAPVHESFQGYYLFVPSSEYTVQQGIADMTYATGYLAATAGDDGTSGGAIWGGIGDETIDGTAADDLINALGGNDRVFGGKGDDIVNLGAGNDYVRVGGGSEQFDGGTGKDWISYYDASAGITANLAEDTVSGSWAVNDTIANFESISGSRTGDDEITGTGGANTIKTYGGDDRVFAGKGADKVYLGSGDDYVRVGGGAERFEGGAGKDYISYYDSSNGIRIDLAADTVSGSWAVNDTIKSFEGASGSGTGDDVMLGTSGANTLKGFGGDDKLYGRSGDDKLYGGSGSDRFDGGAGTDRLWGGSGEDIFHLDFGEGSDIIEDFENNVDVIQLDNFSFAPGVDAFDFAMQVGDDVVFDFGGGEGLTVLDATIGQLANDLVLV